MKIKEVYGNLFDYEDTHDLVHCVSADFKLGAGIALEFNKRYDMAKQLKEYKEMTDYKKGFESPSCVYIRGVYNLITKDKYYDKPTYESMRKALEVMKGMMISFDEEGALGDISMPTIGSGLDRLDWFKVKEIIMDIFKDMDITITIVYDDMLKLNKFKPRGE